MLVFNMALFIEILKIFLERTTADKVLRDKAFNIAKDPRFGINADLFQWFTNFLRKRFLLQTSEQESILKTKN